MLGACTQENTGTIEPVPSLKCTQVFPATSSKHRTTFSDLNVLFEKVYLAFCEICFMCDNGALHKKSSKSYASSALPLLALLWSSMCVHEQVF